MARSGNKDSRRNRSGLPHIARLRQVGLSRIALVLVLGLGGGWLTFTHALAGIARAGDPQLALQMVGDDSGALSAQADLLLLTKAENPPLEVKQLAIASLREQALNPAALRILGYYEDTKGHGAQAARLIHTAANLSRRDAGTQVWLIEEAVRADQLDTVLNHYDALLLTKPEIQDSLFPTLLSALDDAAIQTAFLPFVKSGKPWVSGFLGYAIGTAKDLSPVVSLISRAKGFPMGESSLPQAKALMGRLASERKFTDAYRIFLMMPGAKPQRITDASFLLSDRDGQFGVMDWQIFDDPDVGGAFKMAEGVRIPKLEVFANSATTRTVARKLLYLQPGSYRLQSRLASIDRGKGGYLRWEMNCATVKGSAPFWLLDVRGTVSAAPVDVSADCPVQYLDLVASGGSGQTGLEAVISSVEIKK